MTKDNKILTIHSEWLKINEFFKEAKECKEQAEEFEQKKDKRQTKGYDSDRRKSNNERN